MLRNTRNASDTDESCDDLCRRLLLTGAAKQVLALTAAPTPQRGPTARKTNRLPDWPALDPAPQMSSTAWRLEQRDECGVLKLPNSSRLVNVPEPARPRGTPYVPPASSEQLLRLKIAGGMCLVSKEMPLAQADALLRLDTAPGYRQAASLLVPIAQMDPHEAASVRAFALAMLFADYRATGAEVEADALLVEPNRLERVPLAAGLPLPHLVTP